jgi:transcriptional regulator with XRE-family HTH domain
MRYELSLTQSDVGKAIGLSRQWISRMETQRVASIRADHFVRLMALYGITDFNQVTRFTLKPNGSPSCFKES